MPKTQFSNFLPFAVCDTVKTWIVIVAGPASSIDGSVKNMIKVFYYLVFFVFFFFDARKALKFWESLNFWNL